MEWTKQRNKLQSWINKTSSRGKCCHTLVCVKQDLKPGWADHQFPSHHPLRLERRPAAHTLYEIRENSKLSTSPSMEESPGKKNKKLMLCCFVQGSFLLTWTFRFLAGRLITVTATATYHKWIKKWSTLLHHKIKTTWKDVCKSWRRPRGFQQQASITSPTAPLCRQEYIWWRKRKLIEMWKERIKTGSWFF